MGSLMENIAQGGLTVSVLSGGEEPGQFKGLKDLLAGGERIQQKGVRKRD